MKNKNMEEEIKKIYLSECNLPDIKNDSNQKRVCKITGEFIEGFNFVADISKAVTIFGSNRSLPENPYYQKAIELAGLLAKEKFTVITGGGQGIMEAANRGAYEAHGDSIGINIKIPKFQAQNNYVTKSIRVDYFFTRKVMMVSASFGYVFFPGGFGTLDEFFEVMNLAVTNELNKKPLIIVVGKDYWQPLLNWLKDDVTKKDKYISVEDLDIIQLVDSAQEAFDIIKKNSDTNY